MIIEIDFEVTKGWSNSQGRKGQHITLPVDLDLLSPLAQRVAQGIRTTDNNNPLCQVRLRSHLTLGTLMGLAPYIKVASWAANINIPVVESTLLPGLVDQPEIFTWHWGKLAAGETPEAFLNRNAQAMLDFGEVIYLAVEHFSNHGVRCTWGAELPLSVKAGSPAGF